MLDGFTGDQRFFLAYAQGWRAKQRDDALRANLRRTRTRRRPSASSGRCATWTRGTPRSGSPMGSSS